MYAFWRVSSWHYQSLFDFMSTLLIGLILIQIHSLKSVFFSLPYFFLLDQAHQKWSRNWSLMSPFSTLHKKVGFQYYASMTFRAFVQVSCQKSYCMRVFVKSKIMQLSPWRLNFSRLGFWCILSLGYFIFQFEIVWGGGIAVNSLDC
jgi:hypothetical protein